MKKVLLYEPGHSGHRAVILRYLTDGLQAYGWFPEICRDPALAALTESDLVKLDAIARTRGCELIHLLTIDGCGRNWLMPRRNYGRRLPVIGNYYLYNNLWGLKSIAWALALRLGYIDKILVSDEMIDGRIRWPGVRRKLAYVPDPWSKADFVLYSQVEARLRLGLPLNAFLVLVFGEVSVRKGVPRIISALKKLGQGRVKIVFAGVVSDDSRLVMDGAISDPSLSEDLILRDHYISEADVSLYFCAANAVLSDYPKTFLVSSGVFTRAIAAGRLPIFPDRGVNAEVISRIQYGITYKGESVDELSKALERASVLKLEAGAAVSREAERRELGIYISMVVSNYNEYVCK